MCCGDQSGTKTVRKQFCDLEDYRGDTTEYLTENPFYQRLIEIIHEDAKGDISTLHSKDITLVTKHVNERNEILKVIPVRNLSELKCVARASALLVCEKVGFKIYHIIHKKQPFWKQRIEKNTAILRKNLNRIDDWLKGRSKNGSAKLKCDLERKYKMISNGFKIVIEELHHGISADITILI